MTEDEAIARFKSCQKNVGKCEKCRFYSCCGIYDMEDTAIKALEEVQRYRQIGTVEELEAASKYLRLVKKHGTVGKTIEECAEYEEIGTVDECREAMEKQTPKEPDYEGDGYSNGQLVYDTWVCPCCEQRYEVDYDDYEYCPKCGQHIDWSDENEEID